MTAAHRLALPFIMAGQAQKEITHNEAPTLLDMAVCASAESVGDNSPPSAPGVGQSWVIGTLPGGTWAGKANCLATWTENGWRFLQPFQALVVWVLGDSMFARWDGANWEMGIVTANAVQINGEQVIGTRQPSIARPSGGLAVDAEARAAIENILDALESHGLIQV